MTADAKPYARLALVISTFADWLKHLIDEVGVPTVLLGLPRLESLLQINEQLRRRFSRRTC